MLFHGSVHSSINKNAASPSRRVSKERGRAHRRTKKRNGRESNIAGHKMTNMRPPSKNILLKVVILGRPSGEETCESRDRNEAASVGKAFEWAF